MFGITQSTSTWKYSEIRKTAGVKTRFYLFLHVKTPKKTPNSLSNKVATKKETESVTVFSVLAPRYSPLQETNMFVVPTFERYLFQLRCHRRRREGQTLY